MEKGFTRKFIRDAAKESGVEIPKELENALIDAYTSARDAYAEEQVKTALEKNKPEPAPEVEDTEKYKSLKKEYDDYRADQENKAIKAAKETAASDILKSAGLSGKLLEMALKGYDVDGLELENGKAKDFDGRVETAKKDYAEILNKGNYTPAPGEGGDKKTDYQSQLNEARKNGSTIDAIRIKREAAADGVILI